MKTALPIGAVLLLAVLIITALHWQRKMESGTPPQVTFATQAEALAAALREAGPSGQVFHILGTGSMYPYLPHAPAGSDPLKTVVAYGIAVPGATFADVQAGTLCVYKAAWHTGGASVMHQAAQRIGDAWSMSGLNNPHYETRVPMRAEDFRAIVAKTFVWKPP